jgi:hypothetical protein
MDELEFRRFLLSEPQPEDARDIDRLNQAISQDASKEKFAQNIYQMEDKIKSAMNVDVPDGLYDKLILRQTLSTHNEKKSKTRFQFAIAASVTLTLGVLLNVMQFSPAYNNLGDYALAHVYYEDGNFDNSSTVSVDLNTLNDKMAVFGGTFTKSLGKLISADYCRFDTTKSLHLVFQGKTSPVTVFIVPKKEGIRFESTFGDTQYKGRSQAYSDNNIIVVSDEEESLLQWQNAINESVNWRV